MMLRRFIAGIQLLLLVIVAVPKELVHELHACPDTTDQHVQSSVTSVSTLHHHCELLQLESPFAYEFCQCEQQYTVCFHTLIDFDLTSCFADIFQEASVARGPPLG